MHVTSHSSQLLHQILLIPSRDKTSPCGKGNVAISSEVEPETLCPSPICGNVLFYVKIQNVRSRQTITIADLIIVRKVRNSVDKTKISPMIKCVLHVVITVL